MHLAEASYDNSETGCCARIQREQWDEREVTWTDKPFLKDHVRAFLHVPLNFGSVMARDHAAIERAAAYPAEPFWLSEEVSPWGSDIFFATDRPVPNAEMVAFSGTFLTKLFEGSYREIGKWVASMNTYAAKKGFSVEKLYFFYATCPNCAKRFGANQVVLFAKVTKVA